jgi:hypothetical protein
MKKYAWLDDQGSPIRWFDYPAKGAVEIKEPKLNYSELINLCGEALL